MSFSESFVAYKPLATNQMDLPGGVQQSQRYRNDRSVLWSRSYIKLIFYLFGLIIILAAIHQLTSTVTQSKYNKDTPTSTPSALISFQEFNETQKLNSNHELYRNEKNSIQEQKEKLFSEFQDDKENLNELTTSSISVKFQDPNDHNDLNDLSYPGSIDGVVWWNVNIRYKYYTVTDYVRAIKSFNFNSSITLTTQATLDFLHHSIELCHRWDGPISIAVYTPGDDLSGVLSTIKFMRDCLTDNDTSKKLKEKITWHLVYDIEHGPKLSNLNFPSYHYNKTVFQPHTHPEPESKQLKLLHNQFHSSTCPHFGQYESQLSVKEQMFATKHFASMLDTKYRSNQLHKLPYPINVLRNTARAAAKTRYVLASDIELYPNTNIVNPFIKLMNKLQKMNSKNFSGSRAVFVLPIFEVKKEFDAPKTKHQLIQLINSGNAIFFHRYVCDACQNFPLRENWIHQWPENTNENELELNVFEVTQRNRSRSSWEPIYIGTNDEPFYDDRLTWDGRRDKMAQMFEMCLMDYRLMVLDNAFLVHAPGIKHIDHQDNMKRLSFIKQNNAIYEQIMAGLRQKYANSSTATQC